MVKGAQSQCVNFKLESTWKRKVELEQMKQTQWFSTYFFPRCLSASVRRAKEQTEATDPHSPFEINAVIYCGQAET